MTKKMQKIVREFEDWKENDLIYKSWEDEDYENTINYESVNGDVISIETDEDGNIVAAYRE